MHRFNAKLWRWDGDQTGSWHFVALPKHVAEDVRARTDHRRRGFGSVRVEATVGSSTWATSIFPDTSRGTFLLPVKKAVRVREGIEDGDTVDVRIDLIER